MATIDQTSTIAPVTAVAAASETPTADQQSAFSSALAAAQLDQTGPAVSQADSDSAKHLALFSMLQQSVLRNMDEVDRNRKAAEESDE